MRLMEERARGALIRAIRDEHRIRLEHVLSSKSGGASRNGIVETLRGLIDGNLSWQTPRDQRRAIMGRISDAAFQAAGRVETLGSSEHHS